MVLDLCTVLIFLFYFLYEIYFPVSFFLRNHFCFHVSHFFLSSVHFLIEYLIPIFLFSLLIIIDICCIVLVPGMVINNGIIIHPRATYCWFFGKNYVYYYVLYLRCDETSCIVLLYVYR